MRRGLVPVVAALLLAATFSGCLGLGGDGTSERAQTLQNDMLDAVNDTESYDVSMSVLAEANDRTVRMEADGTIDRPDRRLRMNMSMSGAAGSADLVAYIADETMYMHVEGRDGWTTQNVSERNLWAQNDQLRQQREMLQDSTVSITGHDTLDGRAVTIMEADPKPSEVKSLLEQQGTGVGSASLKDVTYRVWVGNESSRLYKVETDMTLKQDGTTGSASVTMQVSDYGTNETIEVPEAATAETASA